MATTISRANIGTNDSGAGTDGTIVNVAYVNLMYDNIDALVAAAITFGSSVTATTSVVATTFFNANAGTGAVSYRMSSWDLIKWAAANEVTFGGYTAAQWQKLHLFTNGAEAMTIDSSQNVGVNQTSPGAKLDCGTVIRANSTGIVVSSFVDGINVGTWDMLGYKSVANNAVFGGYRASQWTDASIYTSGLERIKVTTGVQIMGAAGAAPTGGDKGVGTINAVGDHYKNGTAFTNPHGGFEFAYTGRLDRYGDRMRSMGIEDYRGWTLADLEAFTRTHYHFPYFEDAANNGVFSGGERHLLITELLATYLFDQEARLRRLEGAC